MEPTVPSNISIGDLLALSVPEKLAVIGALWDSIDENSEPIPVPAWQLEELERREAADQLAPEPTISWEEAQLRIRRAHAQPRSA